MRRGGESNYKGVRFLHSERSGTILTQTRMEKIKDINPNQEEPPSSIKREK